MLLRSYHDQQYDICRYTFSVWALCFEQALELIIYLLLVLLAKLDLQFIKSESELHLIGETYKAGWRKDILKIQQSVGDH